MWITVEDGELFEGDENHWADCFFSNVTEENIRDFCKQYGWSVKIENISRRDKAETYDHDFTDWQAKPIDRCNFCGVTLDDPKAFQQCDISDRLRNGQRGKFSGGGTNEVT
jgi:hypothetical protein